MNIWSKELLMAIKSGIKLQIACSSDTTWVLLGNGDLYGCGYNYYGQQGNGSTSNVTTFTKRASNVAQVACSSDSTWYIDTNGDLYGCGYGYYGQQGNGNETTTSPYGITTFTKRASNVSQVACSDYTTWYIASNGDLYGCGYNGDGQQGSGAGDVTTFTKRASNVAKVACSNTTTWYLTNSSELYGCGNNSYHQQGNGSTYSVTTFTKKTTNVKDFACSKDTTWYINTSNQLYGCGGGGYGQQGNGTYGGNGEVNYFTYRASNVAQIVCSVDTTWYVTTDGDLYGCGRDNYGQQGDGNSGSSARVTTFTKRASNVAQVTCDTLTTWYLTETGDLYGCGMGSSGQQGSGSTSNVSTFTKRASNVSQVDSGGDYTTWYITTNGDLYGCGYGGFGQQGNGSTSNVTTFENKMQYLT